LFSFFLFSCHNHIHGRSYNSQFNNNNNIFQQLYNQIGNIINSLFTLHKIHIRLASKKKKKKKITSLLIHQQTSHHLEQALHRSSHYTTIIHISVIHCPGILPLSFPHIPVELRLRAKNTPFLLQERECL